MAECSTTRMITFVAATALLSGCAAPSQAPTPRQGLELTPGQEVEGVLRDTTPAYGDRGRFHLYHFRGVEGHRYVVDLSSENFDSYLVVGDRSGGIFNPIRSNDDGGMELDARLAFIAPRTGTYLVVAQALGDGADDIGIYTLRVQDLGEPRPAEPTAIAAGDVVQGELTYDDPVMMDEEGSSYDLYSVRLQPGQRYAISVASDAFDTFLEAGPLRGESIEVTHSDDDGGDGTDSRLLFTAEEATRLGVRVTSFAAGVGPYTLRVDTIPAPGPLTAQELAFGETREGELSLGDHMLPDGTYFDLYSFRGEAGDTVVISLSSDELDMFLSLGRPMGAGEMDVMETDDDGGEGYNARLIYRLPESGEYHVRAESYSGGSTGSYRISLQRDEEEG